MGDSTNALALIESKNVGHYTLAGDVYVKGDINLASNTAEIKHNVKLANTDATAKKLILASDQLDLGAHTLTLSKLHFDSPKEIKFAIDGDTNGKLVLAENSEFNLGTKSTLKATVLGMPFSQGADERVITLFEKDTGSSFHVQGNISGEVRESLEQSLNNMLKAEAVYDAKNNFTGKFRLVDNSEQRSSEIIAELVAAGSSLAQDTRATEITQALVNKNNFAQARKIADILWVLNAQQDKAKSEEALEVGLRVVTPITATLEVVENVAANAMQMVSNRVAFVTNMVDVASAAGVAAGDEASAKFGVWASPLYAHGEQKKRSDARPAYSSKSYGGTVGADTMLNDSTTIGAAVTYAKSDIKMKGLKKGDTSSADTMLFTLYANQKLPNDFFIQGMTSYASSNIKNSEKIAGQFDKTKYDSQSFALEVSGGYNYKVMDNVVFTPMIGVSYSKFMDSSLQNSSDIFGRSMTSKSHDTIEAMIGSRVSASFDAGGFTVSPEAHAFVKQNVNGKTRKVTPKVAGLVTELKELSIKPNLTTVNAGLGVTAKAGAMEYTVGYDATMAKKYVGHQGSLKVRVNF
jgi:outer membrane autotransporter protein